jgi:hypothetical protein
MKTNEDTLCTKVVGVTIKNPDGSSRQDAIRRYCSPGMDLILGREPNNPKDPNTITVSVPTGLGKPTKVQIGNLNRDLAGELAPLMDQGKGYRARIIEIIGGTPEKRALGVNIRILKSTNRQAQLPTSKPIPKRSSSSNALNILIIALLFLLVALFCCCAGFFGSSFIFYGSEGLPTKVTTQIIVTQNVAMIPPLTSYPTYTPFPTYTSYPPLPTYTPFPTSEPVILTPTNQLPAASYPIGEVIDFEDHTLVLNSSNIEGNILKANFTAQNTGSDPFTISSMGNFTARRQDGTSLKQNFDCSDSSLDGTIPPNDLVTGDICYEGPFDGPIKIYYMPNMFGSIIITWEVTTP